MQLFKYFFEENLLFGKNKNFIEFHFPKRSDYLFLTDIF